MKFDKYFIRIPEAQLCFQIQLRGELFRVEDEDFSRINITTFGISHDAKMLTEYTIPYTGYLPTPRHYRQTDNLLAKFLQVESFIH